MEEIASTSEKVVDEFEKVQQLRGQADQLAANLEADAKERMRDADLADYAIIDDFVTNLDQLRRMRGSIEAARDERYIDNDRLDALDEQCATRTTELAERAVGFLLREESLAPYVTRIQELEKNGESSTSVADSDPLIEQGEQIAHELDLLMEIVNTLKSKIPTSAQKYWNASVRFTGYWGARARSLKINVVNWPLAKAAQRLVRNSNCSGKPPRTIWHCVKPQFMRRLSGKNSDSAGRTGRRYVDFPEFFQR